jgi:peroxiredoxin
MNHTPTLAEELSAYKASFKARVAPERLATMEHATAQLRASGIERRALGQGDRAPALTLPDAAGIPVALAPLWQRGALVLVFYRGGWCPYCNLELRAWQRTLARLGALDASLVAISPQTPDNSLTTAQKNELAFPVLSDTALQAAEAFGLAFELPPELVALFSAVGNELPVINGNGKWVLPIPATYVVGTDGRIAFAHVEADYRERAEPDAVLGAVERLQPTNRRSRSPCA